MQQDTAPPSLAPAPAPIAALAIVNARVWTGDPRRPWADAVLVRGEYVEAVGSSAEIRKRAGSAHIVDAGGMMLTPGFVDTHVHLRGTLASGMPADLVLIDRDIARVAPETVRDATVVLTMVSGRIVYDRDNLTH